MSEGARAVRLPPTLALLAVIAALVSATMGLAGPAGLLRDREFAVTAPADGASVGPGFLLSWSAGRTVPAGGYAVVVDEALPRPGQPARPGARTVLLTDTALQLSLGPATTGSPSARGFHVVQVIRLDSAGRRIGEDVAVVHVRGRS